MALTEAQQLAAQQKSYKDILAELTENSIELNRIIQKGTREELAKFYKESNKAAIQYNSLASSVQGTVKTLDAFRTATPIGKMLYMGQALSNAGKSLTDLRDKIYDLQAKLGTTFGTAIDSGAAALTNQITSIFEKGPALSFRDTIDAINAYQKEFGTLLTQGSASEVAKGAKQFGTDINTFVKAQRSFLVGPNGLANQARLQQQYIKEFRSAGLTANQALQFAANNANLVAIAGVKYADALGRAAANATKIGVSLDKTEKFADTLVGDFEGGLERFSELRAMGVEVDFNEIARIAGTGTPEEVQQALSRQLGGNQNLLEELQRNRFLKVALERDLGLDVSDIQRLAAGPGGMPGEKTKEEKLENGIIAGIAKGLGPLLTATGALTSFISFNTLALGANTAALMRSAGIEGVSDLFSGAGGTAMRGMGAIAGTAGMIGSSYAAYQAGKEGDNAGMALSILGSTASGALTGFSVGGPWGALVGAIVGLAAGGLSAFGGTRAAGDIAMGAGANRYILGPEGSFRLSPRDSILAGTNLFDDIRNKMGTGRGYNVKDTIVGKALSGDEGIFNSIMDAYKDMSLEIMASQGAEFATTAARRRAFNSVPIIGDLLAGASVGLEKYQKSGNLLESLYLGGGYAFSSAVGGALGTLGAGALGLETGPGAILTAAAGDMMGSITAGEMFLAQEEFKKQTATKLIETIKAQQVTPKTQPQPTPIPSVLAQSETTITSTRQKFQEMESERALRREIETVNRLKQALETSMASTKIEIDGNTVGRVSLNARSPIDRYSVY